MVIPKYYLYSKERPFYIVARLSVLHERAMKFFFKLNIISYMIKNANRPFYQS